MVKQFGYFFCAVTMRCHGNNLQSVLYGDFTTANPKLCTLLFR